MSRLRTTLVLVILSLAFTIPVEVSHADVEQMQLITDCKTSQSEVCILALYVTDEKGKKVQAQLTGRSQSWKQTYSPISILEGEVEEYSVDGITFSGLAKNLLTPVITYFPIGNTDCYYTPCVEGKEYIQVNTFPSILTPRSSEKLTYSQGNNDLRCGSKAVPDYCYSPSVFGEELVFEYHLRLPEDFTYTAITGRGISKFSFSESSNAKLINGKRFKESVFIEKASRYSTFGVSGADLDQTYPAFEIDTPDFVLWGKNSKVVSTFGECKNLYGVSVVSNTFWIDMPTWDKTEGSLRVQIHGPHYKSDGTLNTAFFQARITKSLAKCLWGVDLQNASQAKISLTYEDGTSVLAVISSAIEGDQYVLSASGMHLSSPTFTMKVIKSASPATPTPASTRSKKTISCVKGNVKKKVTAFDPQCPKGFKRAS
ncbi:hypothetical protein MCEMRE182_00163 [Candidatus Nanopelagicaceae bacterium]